MKASRLPVLAAAFVLCLSGTACKQNVDLGGVGELAKSVAASSDALQALPADFYDSCVRQVTWLRGSILTPPAAPEPAPGAAHAMSPALQSDRIAAELKQILGTLPASARADGFDVQALCQPNKAASEQMLALTAVITDYFSALGRLAETGSTTGIGIDKLGLAVRGLDPNARFNTSGKTAAIATSLDGLASGLIAAQARDDIASEAIAANDLVAKLIGRLISDKTATGDEDNVAAFYLEQLGNERLAMHAFYENNIGATHSGIERLNAFNYYVNEAAEDGKLDARVAAAQSYISALAKLKRAHEEIAQSATTKNLASIESIARAYAQQYQPQIDSLRKAFK
jgi:hypothetical protein